jgi:type I restriction enzyme S subunit
VIESSKNTTRLPKGWVRTSLGEIAEINPKLPCVLQDNAEVSFLPMKAVEELTGRFDASIFVPYIKVKKGYTAFINGDIIFAKITPCMENGKVAVVGNLRNGVGFGSTEFHVIRPFLAEFPRKYLFYYLIQEGFRRDAKRDMTGSAGQLRVPAKYMQDTSLLLPPLPEQGRIVARLEELFTRLDAGVEGLRKVKAQLKRYRQAVLKYAFEGKLTEEWRKTHKNQLEPATKLLEQIKQERKREIKYRELPPMDVLGLPELPENWAWAKLDDITDKIVDGSHNPPPKQDSGIPMLSARNIVDNRIIFSDYRYISLEDFEREKTRVNIKANDVLLTIVGTIGRSAVVAENTPMFAIQRSIAVIRTYVRPKYLSWIIQSPFYSSYFLKRARGTAQKGIYLNQLKEIPIAIPSLLEQDNIVEKIDLYFSIADKIVESTERASAQASRLRQSILKLAFEGKLVPQDPSDEPAEKLLERIREERAMSNGEKDRNEKKNNSRQLELSDYVK